MSASTAPPSRPLPRWRGARAARWGSRGIRWAILAGVFGLLEVLSRAGRIDPLVMPQPTEAISALIDMVPTAEFATDLTRTLVTVGAAFGIGFVLGVALGVISWRIPLLGEVAEPYLATLYAVPTIVFYPILLAIMGLGPGPIIVLATTAALIPVALNTMVALRSINPVLPKMGISVRCSRWQVYRKVLIPAAVPLAIPGVRLGFIYAFVATIAMEFIIADQGLGYRIGFEYRLFSMPKMYGLIIFVALISIVANAALDLVERRIRRDML